MIKNLRQFTFSYLDPKLQNQGENCWRKCNLLKKGTRFAEMQTVEGICPFCGSEGLCCRIGWKGDECDGTIGGSDKHECVARPSKIYCYL